LFYTFTEQAHITL